MTFEDNWENVRKFILTTFGATSEKDWANLCSNVWSH